MYSAYCERLVSVDCRLILYKAMLVHVQSVCEKVMQIIMGFEQIFQIPWRLGEFIQQAGDSRCTNDQFTGGSNFGFLIFVWRNETRYCAHR